MKPSSTLARAMPCSTSPAGDSDHPRKEPDMTTNPTAMSRLITLTSDDPLTYAEPGPDGVWLPEPAGDDARLAPGAELVVGPGGGIVVTGARPAALSEIPAERMAADGWQKVFETIRAEEDGRSTSQGVYVAPGGEITLAAGPEAASRPLSKVPEVRMASLTMEQAIELQRLDPANDENWQPVSAGGVRGWKFRLKAPFQAGYFVFFAFRNPARGNGWDIAPIYPDVDGEYGHKPHLISTTLGGERLTILCGPAGRPLPDLSAVRGTAAKWMLYTSARMAGVDPGFSL